MSASTPMVARATSQRRMNQRTASEHADAQCGAAEDPQTLLVLVPHRAIDDGLRHQRNRDSGTKAGEGGREHRDPPQPILHQIRQETEDVRRRPDATRGRRKRRRGPEPCRFLRKHGSTHRPSASKASRPTYRTPPTPSRPPIPRLDGPMTGQPINRSNTASCSHRKTSTMAEVNLLPRLPGSVRPRA